MKKSISGLIGHNISKSLSPIIYDSFFIKHNINEDYKLIELNNSHEDFSFIKNYKWINVTKPFKERIFKLVTSVSQEVQIIKSINLVIMKDESNIIGYNTDYLGLLDSYDYYKISFQNKKILILGAGGAARSLLYSLKDQKCNKIVMFNRTNHKVAKIKDDFKNILEITNYSKPENFDIIFNATSISFSKAIRYIDEIKQDHTVYYDLNYVIDDLFYNKKYINGLYMLISQAKYNFNKVYGFYPDIKELVEKL